MKKLSSILFLTIISLHFAACTLYANAATANNLQANTTNEFMQFVGEDMLEDISDGLSLDLGPVNNSIIVSNNHVWNISYLANHFSTHSNHLPIYLYTGSIRI